MANTKQEKRGKSPDESEGKRRKRRAGAEEPVQAPRDVVDEAPNEQAGASVSPNHAQTDHISGWNFRDFLVPYILLAISMQKAHGYFIEQYLRGLGLVNIELSTLYRTLRQLEKNGLVSSAWEPGPEGPARRIYSLTDAGRWWLDSGASALEGYRALIDRFFGSYSGHNQGPEEN